VIAAHRDSNSWHRDPSQGSRVSVWRNSATVSPDSSNSSAGLVASCHILALGGERSHEAKKGTRHTPCVDRFYAEPRDVEVAQARPSIPLNPLRENNSPRRIVSLHRPIFAPIRRGYARQGRSQHRDQSSPLSPRTDDDRKSGVFTALNTTPVR
jgi:hypothetical protein